MLLSKNRLYLFTIKGIPIKVDASWIIIFLLVTWTLSTGYYPMTMKGLATPLYYLLGAFTALLLFGSILLHELSHSLVALKMGLPIHEITLFIFGGVAQMGEEPDDPIDQFKIAIAGPLMSLLLALISLGLYFVFRGVNTMPVFRSLFQYLAIINFMIMLFNMAPGLPLDGGRIFMALLWKITGNLEKSALVASWTGRGFGVFMALTGVALFVFVKENGLWLIIVGFFLAYSAKASHENIKMLKLLENVTVADAMSKNPVTIDEDTTLEELAYDYFLKNPYPGYPVVRNDPATYSAGKEDECCAVLPVEDAALTKNGREAAVEETPASYRTLLTDSDHRVKVLGYLSMFDLYQAKKRDNWRNLTAGELVLMKNAPCIRFHPDVSLRKAMKEMSGSGRRCFLVVDNGRLLGTVSRDDITSLLSIRSILQENRRKKSFPGF